MKQNSYQITWTKGKTESSDAFYIRTKVFIIEQGFANEFDDEDEISWHITIYHKEEPIAAGRTFQNQDGSWQVGRICVLGEYRSQNIGDLLMRSIEEKLCSLGAKEARLGAQLQAKGFYLKQGYSTIGEEYLDEHCPHIRMIKNLSNSTSH